MLFLQKRREKNYIRNRKIPEQSARRKKWEEMIHVHAEAEKNIKNVVEDSGTTCIEIL